jgi:hypothetical protein
MAYNRRVKKGTTATLTTYFYDDGENPIDKGAVTVSVASDLGAVLQSGSATNTSGTYTFALTTASTAAIDLLTVTWTSSTEVQTTLVEIVGGFYFELNELRALNDLSSPATYSTSKLMDARRWIEDIIDQNVNASFVRRYARDTFAAYALQPRLKLRNAAYAQKLLSVSVAGAQQSLSNLTLDHNNTIVLTAQGTPWVLYGLGIVDVRYEAAWSDNCPGDLRSVALQAARWRLISTDGQSGIPNRATSITNEFGNVQLATAKVGDRPTGIPDVDAVILSYRDQVLVPGFA